MSWTTSPMVIPRGTSTRPVFLILPTSEKILVPVFPGVPILAKLAPPSLMMNGMLARVSTLLMQVGCPSMPRAMG